MDSTLRGGRKLLEARWCHQNRKPGETSGLKGHWCPMMTKNKQKQKTPLDGKHTLGGIPTNLDFWLHFGFSCLAGLSRCVGCSSYLQLGLVGCKKKKKNAQKNQVHAAANYLVCSWRNLTCYKYLIFTSFQTMTWTLTVGYKNKCQKVRVQSTWLCFPLLANV